MHQKTCRTTPYLPSYTIIITTHSVKNLHDLLIISTILRKCSGQQKYIRRFSLLAAEKIRVYFYCPLMRAYGFRQKTVRCPELLSGNAGTAQVYPKVFAACSGKDSGILLLLAHVGLWFSSENRKIFKRAPGTTPDQRSAADPSSPSPATAAHSQYREAASSSSRNIRCRISRRPVLPLLSPYRSASFLPH